MIIESHNRAPRNFIVFVPINLVKKWRKKKQKENSPLESNKVVQRTACIAQHIKHAIETHCIKTVKSYYIDHQSNCSRHLSIRIFPCLLLMRSLHVRCFYSICRCRLSIYLIDCHRSMHFVRSGFQLMVDEKRYTVTPLACS